MSKRLIMLLGCTLLAIALVACSNSATSEKEESSAGEIQTAATRVVKDTFGDVTIPASPKNIIVTNSSYAEYLIEIGVTPQIVLFVPLLEPEYRTPYFEKHGVKIIFSEQYQFNYEQMLSLSPDLIVAQGEGLEAKTYEDLSKIAPTIAVSAGPGMEEAIPKLAEIFNKTEEANQVLSAFGEKAAKAKEKIHQAIGDKTVLVLRVEPTRYRYLGSQAGNVSTLFYQTLGLKIPEIFKDTKEWFTPFSLEILPDIKPDYIFVEKRMMENYDSSESLKELEENSLWKNMDAVKNNRVFPLKTNDYIQGQGPIGSSMLIDYLVEKLVP
ncbi:iron-uptake system-binding protein [Brevibacillus reuszeri]|uniref:Iron-uptake system-binding protein n=1 Tax=Brevibacillus reuszeri TaxID=54915 RepID=A0A0K9Z1L0_9BACL|nr:ABC transporter substrate-binding protein [Brevibacillus reuszeri]KNB74787.1 hypothetical protein ADS79_00230 [Brevibacillus reuszeri]MED1859565.1 ABC transporter substrate-binding protein [Brevibacillus reuszeri]GED71935.1 iron-uptake system-binding protein [Brevibacillus reuszeri]